MCIKLSSIAYARSGDKGAHSNVGVVFLNKELYAWALDNITEDKLLVHFKGLVYGKIVRYKLDNLNALNFSEVTFIYHLIKLLLYTSSFINPS